MRKLIVAAMILSVVLGIIAFIGCDSNKAMLKESYKKGLDLARRVQELEAAQVGLEPDSQIMADILYEIKQCMQGILETAPELIETFEDGKPTGIDSRSIREIEEELRNW